MHQDYHKRNEDFILNHIGKPITKFSMCFGICLAVWGSQAWGDFHTNQTRPQIIHPLSSGTTSDSQPESYESYQLRILRNQNHLQAEKIKALREEMHEITQKLHDLKPHLFRHGDPADQLKIAKLTQLLGEKEETLNQLTAIKEQLDQDLSLAKKKLGEMEIVKEALAAMVDSHRDEKERNTAVFRKQLEEMQLTAEMEKNGLLKKIQQHEAIQVQLKQQLTTKGQTIQRLDDISSKMNTALTAKNDELLQLEGHMLSLYDLLLQVSEQHQLTTQGHEKQIQDLVAALDLDKMHVDQLLSHKDESQWLFDLYHVTQEKLLTDILQLQDLLEAEQDKNDMHRQVNRQNENQLQQKSGYLQQLVLLIEFEQMRNQKLENQLLTLLEQQESGQHHLDDMEAQLFEVNSRLASKHDELENTISEYNMNLAALLSHLDSGEISEEKLNEELDKITTKYQENIGTLLSHLGHTDDEVRYHKSTLEHAHNRYAQELGTLFSHLDHENQASHYYLINYKKLNQRLEEMLADHQNKEDALQRSLEEMLVDSQNKEDAHQRSLEEMLADNQNKEDAHQRSLEEIRADIQNKEDAHQRSLEEMIADHKNKEDALKRSLEEMYEAYKQENHRLAQLEDLFEETAHDLQLSQTDITSKSVLIAAQENQLAEREEKLIKEAEKLSQEAVYSLQLQNLLQDNLTSLQQVTDALDDYYTALKNKEIDYHALKQTLAQMTEELAVTENELRWVEEDNKELVQENHLLQEKTSTHELANKEMKEENDKLNIFLEQLRNDSEQMQQKLAVLANLERQLQEQADRLEEKDYHIQAMADNHTMNQQIAEETHRELHGQLQDILIKLSAQEERNKALIDDLNYARSNYTRERSNLSNLEKILQENQSQMDELKKQHEEHQTELSYAQRKVGDILQSKAQIKEKYIEISDHNQQLRDRVDELEKQLQDRNRENSSPSQLNLDYTETD